MFYRRGHRKCGRSEASCISLILGSVAAKFLANISVFSMNLLQHVGRYKLNFAFPFPNELANRIVAPFSLSKL